MLKIIKLSPLSINRLRSVKHMNLSIAFFLVCVFIVTAQEDTLQEIPHVPDGWIAVREETWIHLLDEPSGYFRKSHEMLLVEDYKIASTMIKKTVSLINIEANRARKRKIRVALISSLKELKFIAKEMVRGKRIKLTDLEAVFARAEYALAAHQYYKAMEYKKKEEFLFVGFSMSSTCKHLRNGWSWSHQPVPGDDLVTLKQVQEISSTLKEGEDVPENILNESIKKLGVGVQNLQKKVPLKIKK